MSKVIHLKCLPLLGLVCTVLLLQASEPKFETRTVAVEDRVSSFRQLHENFSDTSSKFERVEPVIQAASRGATSNSSEPEHHARGPSFMVSANSFPNSSNMSNTNNTNVTSLLQDLRQQLSKALQVENVSRSQLQTDTQLLFKAWQTVTDDEHKLKQAARNSSIIEGELILANDNMKLGMLSKVLVGIFLCLCFVPQCFCFVGLVVTCPAALKSSYSTWLGYIPIEDFDEVEMYKLISRECRYMLAIPLIPIVLYPWTSCQDGVPIIGYLIYFVFLIRSKLVELHILIRKDCGVDFGTFLKFVYGSLDHMDYFTDAAFPVQAFLCDTSITPIFAATFSESTMPSLAGVVLSLHFWGICALAFLAGAFSQQLPAMFVKSDSGDGGVSAASASAADAAGMQALSAVLEQPYFVKGLRMSELFTFACKVMIENLIQLWLQSSYFGITFNTLSDSGKGKVLFSICCGISGAFCRSFVILKLLYTGCRECTNDPGKIIMLTTLIIFYRFTLTMLAWTIAKLYFAFRCGSHLWNLTSGCVSLDTFF